MNRMHRSEVRGQRSDCGGKIVLGNTVLAGLLLQSDLCNYLTSAIMEIDVCPTSNFSALRAP